MLRCRLLIDGPARGAWNMAVDEALLAAAEPGAESVLRFYAWSEPTLSLGYFQPFADRCRHSASAHCPVVRHSSGGGAIVHDRELTYSWIVPHSHLSLLAAVPESSLQHSMSGHAAETWYALLHTALIAALADCGDIHATLHRHALPDPQTPPAAAPPTEPFLCFQRRAPWDVVLHGAKIAGSAQRRRRHALLQHGSVLLARSIAAPELPGINDLVEKSQSADALCRCWVSQIQRRLPMDCFTTELAPRERQLAEELAASRFGSEAWTTRR